MSQMAVHKYLEEGTIECCYRGMLQGSRGLLFGQKLDQTQSKLWYSADISFPFPFYSNLVSCFFVFLRCPISFLPIKTRAPIVCRKEDSSFVNLMCIILILSNSIHLTLHPLLLEFVCFYLVVKVCLRDLT